MLEKYFRESLKWKLKFYNIHSAFFVVQQSHKQIICFLFLRRHQRLPVKESVQVDAGDYEQRPRADSNTRPRTLSSPSRRTSRVRKSTVIPPSGKNQLKSISSLWLTLLFFDEWNFLPCERNHKIVVWIWKENTKTWFEVNTSHQFFRDDRAYNSSCPTQSHRDTSQRETDWISSTRSEFDCAF